MKLPHVDFQKGLIVFLSVGCIVHPASSAIGLLIVCGAGIADRYFTRNVSDQDRRSIAALKADLDKIRDTQQKDGLAKAFGARA